MTLLWVSLGVLGLFVILIAYIGRRDRRRLSAAADPSARWAADSRPELPLRRDSIDGGSL